MLDVEICEDFRRFLIYFVLSFESIFFLTSITYFCVYEELMKSMQTLGYGDQRSHIHFVAVDTRTCPRLDCGRVEVRRSVPQNRQLVLQADASIVNEVPALQDTITKSCSLDLHLKVFRAHLVCDAMFLRCYGAMHLLLHYRAMILESKRGPRNYIRNMYLEFWSFQSKSSLSFTYDIF